MSLIRVLLGGGNVAGRIVEVDENASSFTISVPDYSTGPPFPDIIQTYRPSGEMSTSGYPMWAVVVDE